VLARVNIAIHFQKSRAELQIFHNSGPTGRLQVFLFDFTARRLLQLSPHLMKNRFGAALMQGAVKREEG